MTGESAFGIVPPLRGSTAAPTHLDLSEVSIVVAVKDNELGIRRLLMACLSVFSPHHCPKEIILVDNRSRPQLSLPVWASWLPVRILICSRLGLASAYNVGARVATGEWLLFLGSLCQPTERLIEGYQQALNGAVAYAGTIQAEGVDLLSRYYDMQEVLIPPPLLDQGEERPNFLITANALVWRRAFFQIGGFDERLDAAGGEDIDLGLRLWSVGPLAYAPQALVIHTFEPDLFAFLRRFAGSGRANRRLARYYHVNLTPCPLKPAMGTLSYTFLAQLQWLASCWGYATGRLIPLSESRCIPWPEEAQKEPERRKSLNKEETSKADVALFIDADNISPEAFGQIWKTVTGWGPVRFCGVYCQRLSPRWEQVRQRYPQITICGEAGKETDAILIEDAETWAHSPSLRRFCLVSNDGDFAKLAKQLSQVGEVLGIGMPNASVRLKQACSRFVTLSVPQKTATS